MFGAAQCSRRSRESVGASAGIGSRVCKTLMAPCMGAPPGFDGDAQSAESGTGMPGAMLLRSELPQSGVD